MNLIAQTLFSQIRLVARRSIKLHIQSTLEQSRDLPSNFPAHFNNAYFFLIFEIVFPIDFGGLSISAIAKSMASSIRVLTLGFR